MSYYFKKLFRIFLPALILMLVISSGYANTVIKNADMSSTMKNQIIGYAQGALKKYANKTNLSTRNKEQWMAYYIEKQLGGNWKAIVGKNFGSYVTHQIKHFIYFYIDNWAFLVFKP